MRIRRYDEAVGTLVLALRFGLAAIFATAGIGKLLDREGSERALSDFRVPRRAIRAGAVLLPLVELAVAVGLIFPPTARWGALAALVVLLAFIWGIGSALSRGEAPDCHCFGQIHSAPAGRGTLLRNAALAGLAIVVLAAGPGPGVHTWVADRSAAELVAIGLGLAALLFAAAAVRFWLENRTLRGDLAAAEAGLPDVGFPVGAPAPDFALSGLDGETVTLKSLCSRGNPVAIIFVGPQCGPCWLVLPYLRRWQDTLVDRLTVVMISTGTPAENEDAIVTHGISGIFLHDGLETMHAYRVKGTPSAVMVSPAGRIISTTVEGNRAIEPLVRMTLHGGEDTAAAAPGAALAQPPAA